MTAQTIYKRAIDSGYSAEIVPYTSGKYAVIVDGFGLDDFFNGIEKLFKRAKVHIDIHIYARRAVIMATDDYNEHKIFCNNIDNLVNAFWEAIHGGKNQQEAKQIQHDYAMQHNCIEAFNHIYHI